MHICFLSGEYPHPEVGPSGGIGTSIKNLARKLVQKGHRVRVIGWHSKEIELEDEGVRLRYISATKAPKLGWFLNRKYLQDEVNHLVRQGELDMVEAPDWGGMTAGMKLHCPLLIRCNGTDTYFGELLGYKPRWSVYQAERMALSGADNVAAVSAFAGKVTRTVFNLPSEIKTIPNGISIEQFKPSNKANIIPNTILYFGTLVRKKGILDLMRIFKIVAAENPAARLLLLGRDAIDRETGCSTWSLCQNLLDTETSSKVEWMGAVAYEKVKEWIARANVCVFPSYAECLPLSWMEAMAMEKAIVASNIGWAKEMIDDNISGFLVSPKDHDTYAERILNLLDDPIKSQMFGKNARKKVESDFNIDIVAEKSIQWYSEVISSF